MRANTLNRLIATSALTALLTACGGGGGGGGSSFLGGGGGGLGGGSSEDHSSVEIVINNSLTQTDPNSFLTAEYTRTAGTSGHTGLAQINAATAYGLGATGNGIKIGLIDTGIAIGTGEFADAISSDSINIINGSTTDLQGSNPHGTWVAGVLGARKNGTYTHGVAFNSQLLVIRSESTTTSCPTGCFSSGDLVNAVNYAAARDAAIVNMSFGSRGSLGGTLTTAMQNAVASDDILFVVAAGNGGYSSVDAPANLGATAGIAGNLLAVGAVDINNNMPSWSNRAGDAASYYLVAPGVNIVTTDEAGMAMVSGTSFAAPMVSGAAALVKEYAPYLTSAQVAQILLDTATDLGAVGTDLIYGHGLLNVGAALQPVGTSSVPSGGATVSTVTTAPVEITTLALGSAFGNALEGNSLLQRGIMLDSYGRAFGFDMAARVQNASYTSSLNSFIDSNMETTSSGARMGTTTLISSFTAADDHLVRDLDEQDGLNGVTQVALSTAVSDEASVSYTHGYGIGQAFGLTAESDVANNVVEKAAFGNAYLNLVEGGNAALADVALAEGLTLKLATGAETGTQSFTSNTQTSDSRSAYAAALNYNMGNASIGINAGMVDEGNGMLGSDGNGALAFGAGSNTTFVGATAKVDLRKGLTLAASYTIGTTTIKDAANSLIGDFRNVRSDTFAVALTADDVVRKDDRLTFAVSQPVRVQSGSANLTVATGVDAGGAVAYENQRVKLTPTGRQMDVQAGYALKVSDKETIGFSTVGTLNPGHDASADTAFSVGVRYNKKF